MEKAADYARLSRQVYAMFEDREDYLGYNDHEKEWLAEDVWPLLEK